MIANDDSWWMEFQKSDLRLLGREGGEWWSLVNIAAIQGTKNMRRQQRSDKILPGVFVVFADTHVALPRGVVDDREKGLTSGMELS